MIARIVKFGVTAIAALSLVSAAFAQSSEAKALVDAAKDRGVVGEQADGYLGWVSASEDAALRAAVNEINAARAAHYRQLAAQRGVPIEAVQAATGQQVFREVVTTGQYYRTADGTWRRK